MEIKNKNKFLVIAESYLKDLPVNSEWYSYRLEKCRECDQNTDNNEATGTLAKVTQYLGGSCNICGCLIKRKCASVTECCPLPIPKWNRILIVTGRTSHFDIINIDSNYYNIDISNNKKEFIFSIGSIDNKSSNYFAIGLKIKPKNLVVKSINPSCSCIEIKPFFKDNKTVILDSIFNPLSMKSGAFSKYIEIRYMLKGRENFIIIRIKGNIQ